MTVGTLTNALPTAICARMVTVSILKALTLANVTKALNSARTGSSVSVII